MRVSTVGYIMLTCLISLLPVAAFAGSADIDLPDTFLQGQFEDLSEQVGMAISYSGVSPAEPLGFIGGFDIGIEATAVNIDADKSFWKDAVGETPPSYLIFPKIHVQKGLPFGFDVGAVYAKAPQSNVALVGGELKWAVIKGGIALPAVAVRGSYTELLGVDDIDLNTYGVDLSISKGFTFLTPYVGVGRVWIRSKETSDIPTLDLDDEKPSFTRGFVGLKLSVFVLSFVAEAEFSEVPRYTLRANISL